MSSLQALRQRRLGVCEMAKEEDATPTTTRTDAVMTTSVFNLPNLLKVLGWAIFLNAIRRLVNIHYRRQDTEGLQTVDFELDTGITLSFITIADSNNVTDNWNLVNLYIRPYSTRCHDPQFKLRFIGDARFSIPFELSKKPAVDLSSYRLRVTAFCFPYPGSYDLEILWSGCNSKKQEHRTLGSFLVTETAVHNVTQSRTPKLLQDANSSQEERYMFSPGVWISKNRINTLDDTIAASDDGYAWLQLGQLDDYSITPVSQNSSWNLSSNWFTYQSSSSSSGNTLDDGVHDAHVPVEDIEQLSNYETVCWVGGESARSLHQQFMILRPQISPQLRPDTFQYYPVTSFANPGKHMREGIGAMTSRCKQIFVLMDEIEEEQNTSENAELTYATQLLSLVENLGTCIMNDQTWSIWVLTMHQEPKIVYPPRSTMFGTMFGTMFSTSNDLKVDDVNFGLKALFHNHSDELLSDNVRLMDNTDLSQPAWEDNDLSSVEANIALRMFHIIGQQVRVWRDAGQIVLQDGLHRGDQVYEGPPVTKCF